MTYKEDPRAIRTQEMLKEALLTLLQEGHSLHQISIQKLTQRANLNRTTFYLHYQNINELKEHLTNDIFQVLTDKIENLTSTFDRNRQQHLLQLLDYLLEQRNHILALVQFEQIEKHLLLLMKDLIVVRRSNSKSIGRKVVVDPDVKTASIVGIIMWWLKDGLHLDSTYIAEQINLMYPPSSLQKYANTSIIQCVGINYFSIIELSYYQMELILHLLEHLSFRVLDLLLHNTYFAL